MMNMQERFENFKDPNYFSRVDVDHILDIHFGLDNKGRKAIELRAKFQPVNIFSTSGIEVNQYNKPEYNTIRFSLIDDEISGLFYTFCDDLIEQTRFLKTKDEGYRSIINRYHQWRKLFVAPKKKLLSESEIMGLIGEILFLKSETVHKMSLIDALKSWSGQELTHKDFSIQDTWFEIKTIKKSAQTIKISSIEQLESKNEGELVVYGLERMSEKYNGINLNKLIIDTRNLFKTDFEKDEFSSKVAIRGYEFHDYYNDFVFEVCSLIKFKVTESFPKLTRESIPKAIKKATYEISLTEIADFEIKL